MKLIFLLLLIVSTSFIHALDHGVITGFKVGYNIYDQATTYYRDRQISNKDFSNSISIELQTGYYIGNFRIIGTYENTLFPNKIDSYIPVQDKYTIDINYTWGDFTIGFQHWCSHPVIAFTGISGTQDYLENSAKRQIYIKYYKEF